MVELSNETTRWRARDVTFIAGRWEAVSQRIPSFVIKDFKAMDSGPANPYMRSVVRVPVSVTEWPMPVGVVSNTYRLAQHKEVVEKCFEGLRSHDIDTSTLRCELGLTPLGEWMNFRAYLPDAFSFDPRDKQKVALRLECFNSVDGSARLVILLSWLRLVCSNGMTIRETMAELNDVHDGGLNLERIPEIISEGLGKISQDSERLARWNNRLMKLDSGKFEKWIDGHLAAKWGKKAACRALHICRSGMDVELADPFEGGKPSRMTIKTLGEIPGAAKPARNLYDVCQALSWIASRRNSADERLKWQGQISALIENLAPDGRRARTVTRT